MFSPPGLPTLRAFQAAQRTGGVSAGLPRGVSGKQAVAALERAGWRAVRTKGDHQILKHPAPRPDAYAMWPCRCIASWPSAPWPASSAGLG